MVSVLAAYGWVVLDQIEEKQAGAMVVNVTGQQFAWRFDYPDEGKVKSNQLVLAKDRPVEFHVRTEDVLHDFWVPEFRLKTDAVPGQVTKIRLTPSRLGEYEVVCAELCGLGHATMRQNVRVVESGRVRRMAGIRAGQGGRRGAAAGAGGDQATAAGKEVFVGDGGCTACHTLADAESSSAIGPGLDELDRRRREVRQAGGPVARGVREDGDRGSRRLPGAQLQQGRDARRLQETASLLLRSTLS